MKSIAYVIAALAAVGIMVGIANIPSDQAETAPQDGQVASSTTDQPQTTVVAKTTEVLSDSGTLTLSVPDMHCSFACFPTVKETLEGEAAVKSVELAEQKEDGVIDNRKVVVAYEKGFDLTKAIAALKANGFESELDQ